MNRTSMRQVSRRRGAATVAAVYFTLIISIMLMGVGIFATGHQSRQAVDAKYAAALDAAEAGLNFEFRKISQDPSTADQSPGGKYSLGNSAFSVYCTNRDGSTPWSAPDDLYVISTGIVDGVRRTIRAAVKGYGLQGDYAIYAINSLDLQGSVDIVGDVGSNGAISITGGGVNISGSVYLNGPAATYSGSLPSVTNSQALEWETVEQVALRMFPNSGATAPGGLAYLRSHNDNASVGLNADGYVAAISGNITLNGPGNYFVNSISLTGNKQLRFNNTNGPVNVWVGPAGGTGTVDFNGTTDGTTDESQGGHQVNMYVATTGTVSMQGNSTFKANLYAYNRDSSGNGYGNVVNGGNPDVYGTVLAWDVYLFGTPGVWHVPGVEAPSSIGYYGYDTSWLEVNPR